MLYPPHIMGGAERSVSILAEAMASLGHDVAAVCTTPGPAVQEVRNGVKVYRMPHETDFWAEEWPDHSKLERGLRRFKQQFNYKLEDHFKNVICDFRPDVVHTHSLLDVSTRVWLAAASLGLPIVHTLRDFDIACGSAAMFRNGKRCTNRCIECRAFTFMKRYHHREVGAVVGVGKGILDAHISMGYFSHVPDHLRRVIWNPAAVEGIEANYVKPSLESKPITFGYLGRINVEKGIGTLIAAVRKLTGTPLHVLIAGKEASEAGSLQPSASGLPIDFIGFTPPREFFDKIDVLIVPSIWAEPLPRTILESYAAGVPVIGARSGGIPDLIGADNGDWLFEPGDVDGLSAIMQKVVDGGRNVLPGREDFLHVVEETTPRKVAMRYLQLYRDVSESLGATTSGEAFVG